MNFSQIYEGWRNDLFPPEELKQLIKQVSDDRKAICEVCPHMSVNAGKPTHLKYCTLCSCPISKKSKCLSCTCPDTPPRWEAVSTEEQELHIKENLK
jgi:hypothetical protein